MGGQDVEVNKPFFRKINMFLQESNVTMHDLLLVQHLEVVSLDQVLGDGGQPEKKRGNFNYGKCDSINSSALLPEENEELFKVLDVFLLLLLVQEEVDKGLELGQGRLVHREVWMKFI